MMHLMRAARLKRWTASIATFALLAMLVMPVLPAAAATPGTASGLTPTPPNSVHVASIDGTCALGINGSYSLEVTGTQATRAEVQSTAQYPTAESRLAPLSLLSVDSSTTALLKFKYTGGSLPATDAVVSGLTVNSTVQDVVTALGTQFGNYITIGYDGANRIHMYAKTVGATTDFGVYDSYPTTVTPNFKTGMASAVFGGLTWAQLHAPTPWSWTDGSTQGTDYSGPLGGSFGGYGIVATFTPTLGNAFPVGVTMGHMNGAKFESGVETSTGFLTAFSFTQLDGGNGNNPGYNFVGHTASESAAEGIAPGKFSFVSNDGVRDLQTGPVTAATATTGAPEAECAATQTVTFSITPTGTTQYGGDRDALNGVKITLPAGFSWNATPTAADVSIPASVTVSGNEVTIDHFIAKGGASAFTFTPSIKNSSVKGIYMFGMQLRNVGGAYTAFTGTNYNSGYTGFPVTEGSKVANIVATAGSINAGGYSKICFTLYDKCGNEITNAHPFQAVIATQPAPGGSLWLSAGQQPSQPTTLTGTTAASPQCFYLKTSTTAGVSQVVITTDNTSSPNATVTVDTTNVGPPCKLVIATVDGKTSYPSTMTPQFVITVVDKDGHPTSFLRDRDMHAKAVEANNGSWPTDGIEIPQGMSSSAPFVIAPAPDAPTTWTVSAWDEQGEVAPSNLLNIDFGGTLDAGVAYRLKITAVKPIPTNNMGREEALYGTPNLWGYQASQFGWAQACPTCPSDNVTFTAQVVDRFGNPVKYPGLRVEVAKDAGDEEDFWTFPGVISGGTGPGGSTVATTNADGQVTVSVSSKEPSRLRTVGDLYDGYNGGGGVADVSAETWFTPFSFDSTLSAGNNSADYGFAFFDCADTPMLKNSKCVALADGQDSITFSATINSVAFDTPLAGVPVKFLTDFGTLSNEGTVTTDAQGKVSVTLTSSQVGDAHVKLVMANGWPAQDSAYSFDEVNFTDVVPHVQAVSSPRQAGGTATGQFKVWWTKLGSSTPINFDQYGGFDMGDALIDVLPYGDYEFTKVETTTVDGKVVGNALIYTITPGCSSEGTRTFMISYCPDDRPRTTVPNVQNVSDHAPFLELTNGIFVQKTFWAGKAQDSILFTNQSQLHVTYNLATHATTISGSNFLPGDALVGRLADISIPASEPAFGEQDLGHITICGDGTVKNEYRYSDSPYHYLQYLTCLEPGTYDLEADCMSFPGALTVINDPGVFDLGFVAPAAETSSSPIYVTRGSQVANSEAVILAWADPNWDKVTAFMAPAGGQFSAISSVYKDDTWGNDYNANQLQFKFKSWDKKGKWTLRLVGVSDTGVEKTVEETVYFVDEVAVVVSPAPTVVGFGGLTNVQARVVNAVTGKPIEGAAVHFVGTPVSAAFPAATYDAVSGPGGVAVWFNAPVPSDTYFRAEVADSTTALIKGSTSDSVMVGAKMAVGRTNWPAGRKMPAGTTFLVKGNILPTAIFPADPTAPKPTARIFAYVKEGKSYKLVNIYKANVVQNADGSVNFQSSIKFTEKGRFILYAEVTAAGWVTSRTEVSSMSFSVY